MEQQIWISITNNLELLEQNMPQVTSTLWVLFRSVFSCLPWAWLEAADTVISCGLTPAHSPGQALT